MCYIISAKDSVQRFQDYCKGGEFPVFLPREDTYAVPVAEMKITKRDYRVLVRNGCKVCVGIVCVDRDPIGIEERKSDQRLFIDYTKKAESACDTVVGVCASSDDGQGIVLEEKIFDLLCTIHKLRKVASGSGINVCLQAGSCNNYVGIMLDVAIMSAYLKIESQVDKGCFVQALQEKINVYISDNGKEGVGNFTLPAEFLREISGDSGWDMENTSGSEAHETVGSSEQEKLGDMREVSRRLKVLEILAPSATNVVRTNNTM